MPPVNSPAILAIYHSWYSVASMTLHPRFSHTSSMTVLARCYPTTIGSRNTIAVTSIAHPVWARETAKTSTDSAYNCIKASILADGTIYHLADWAVTRGFV